MVSCHYAKGFILAILFGSHNTPADYVQYWYELLPPFYKCGNWGFKEAAECHAHTQGVSNGDGHHGTPEHMLAYCLRGTGVTRGIGTRKISQGAFPRVVGLVHAVFRCERWSRTDIRKEAMRGYRIKGGLRAQSVSSMIMQEPNWMNGILIQYQKPQILS